MDARRVRRWSVVLQPGDALDYVAADWADTLVVVRSGELELECRSGRRARFAAGAVLALAAVPVRRLLNTGPEALVLSAIARRHHR
jgi:allophanate hydrolase subunit 2